jgi:hypothetical protein
MFNINLNYCELKKNLGFLVKQDFVEKRIDARDRVVFGVTKRGINVLNYFQVPKHTKCIAPKETHVTFTLPSNHGFSEAQEQLNDFS